MSIALDNPSLAIPVDREHSRLRLSIIVIFIVLWAIGFGISNALIPSAGFDIIAILIGFGVAALGGRLIEPVLRQRWPSGRTVTIDERSVRLALRDQVQTEIKANEAVSALLWRFKVRRRGRVPKGWYVVACALEQDDNYLAVYTFASPEQCDTLGKNAHFIELLGDKALKNVKQDSLRVAGEQRRLHLAEAHRWHEGAEMTFEDFEQFFTRLNGQFPQWIP